MYIWDIYFVKNIPFLFSARRDRSLLPILVIALVKSSVDELMSVWWTATHRVTGCITQSFCVRALLLCKNMKCWTRLIRCAGNKKQAKHVECWMMMDAFLFCKNGVIGPMLQLQLTCKTKLTARNTQYQESKLIFFLQCFLVFLLAFLGYCRATCQVQLQDRHWKACEK